MYLVKTPWWLQRLYGKLVWHIPTTQKVLYLTFDDGPHEMATPFVLQTLLQYQAKATFFCIGKNVVENMPIYNQILQNGHTVGNHTHNHVNGFKTTTSNYVNNTILATKYIKSNLFRPPYGRIKRQQILQLLNNKNIGIEKIIMWSVLSGDFDEQLSAERCLQNVLTNCSNGSIIVFHDSAKAWPRLQYVLPKMLEYFSKKGYVFKAL
jgi:peptidoglycan-N-acetylglucosamine deacetylase